MNKEYLNEFINIYIYIPLFHTTTMPTEVPEHVAAAVDVFFRRAKVPCDEYIQILQYPFGHVRIDSEIWPCWAIFVQGPMDPMADKSIYQHGCRLFNDS